MPSGNVSEPLVTAGPSGGLCTDTLNNPGLPAEMTGSFAELWRYCRFFDKLYEPGVGVTGGQTSFVLPPELLAIL